MESLNELIVKHHERDCKVFRSFMFTAMYGRLDVNFERLCHLEDLLRKRLQRAIKHRDKFEYVDIGGSE